MKRETRSVLCGGRFEQRENVDRNCTGEFEQLLLICIAGGVVYEVIGSKFVLVHAHVATNG